MRCEICESNPALHECRLCGRKICDEDFDQDFNMCKSCRSALCKICRRRLSIGICKYCGRVGCEDCMVQLSLTEYACIECHRSCRKRIG